MADLEKEKRIVLIIETAQIELKKIIQQGILLQLEKKQLKAMTIDLIDKTKLKLREEEADESLILETELALKRSFMLWYENIYLKAIKTDEEGLKPQITPIVKKQTGGMRIGDSLKRESIENIREFQTIYEEGGAGYYYDYTKQVRQAMDELANQKIGVGKGSLRNSAEIKVRYEVINDDLRKLKDKGTKFVISSSHANASERCSWWQGKIFELDIDIATREMGQYGGTKPKQTIKGYIDGKPYYSLKEACENGFLSYNCQHRLIAYYKGIHIQEYDLLKVEKKRNISQTQRGMERQIRNLRTRLVLATDEQEEKVVRKKLKSWKKKYATFCETNNVPRYDWRTKIID